MCKIEACQRVASWWAEFGSLGSFLTAKKLFWKFWVCKIGVKNLGYKSGLENLSSVKSDQIFKAYKCGRKFKICKIGV